MSNETFYWFDYETWGISPQWDRPAQFAGVRTDADLNIVGTPDMFYCKLPPDYLPNPQACLITRLQPTQVNTDGLIEPDFMSAVVQKIGSPGTCSVGYNSIRFDDEVTRHALFRNFHDPYRHEWFDGNSRWDLLDVVRMTRALRPDGIQWPVDEHGVANNKLENLTQINGLQHDQAHDALSDVYATIAVAKLIKNAQSKLYDYALSLRNKQRVSALLNWQKREPMVHISGMVPLSRHHTSIVVPLMRHPTNSNGVIVLDLRSDPEQLIALNEEEIRRRLFDRGLADEDRLHLRTVHTNRCPMLAPMSTLDEPSAQRIGIHRQQQLERAKKVSLVTEEHLNVIGNALTFQQDDKSKAMDAAMKICPEASLYSGGFLSEADRKRASNVIQSSPEQLIGFIESNGHFDDARLQKLLANYRARYALNTLNDNEREAWQEDCIERLADDDLTVPWSSLAKFDDQMDELSEQWPSNAIELHTDLLHWRERVETYLEELV